MIGLGPPLYGPSTCGSGATGRDEDLFGFACFEYCGGTGEAVEEEPRRQLFGLGKTLGGSVFRAESGRRGRCAEVAGALVPPFVAVSEKSELEIVLEAVEWVDFEPEFRAMLADRSGVKPLDLDYIRGAFGPTVCTKVRVDESVCGTVPIEKVVLRAYEALRNEGGEDAKRAVDSNINILLNHDDPGGERRRPTHNRGSFDDVGERPSKFGTRFSDLGDL